MISLSHDKSLIIGDDVQALILAAGMGSRLGKYTKDNTKCMLEINGETLIKQVMEKLNNVGITKLILVVG